MVAVLVFSKVVPKNTNDTKSKRYQ